MVFEKFCLFDSIVKWVFFILCRKWGKVNKQVSDKTQVVFFSLAFPCSGLQGATFKRNEETWVATSLPHSSGKFFFCYYSLILVSSKHFYSLKFGFWWVIFCLWRWWPLLYFWLWGLVTMFSLLLLLGRGFFSLL